ncbi:unnamed protein product [Discosporangium mesarthrocarpum]
MTAVMRRAATMVLRPGRLVSPGTGALNVGTRHLCSGGQGRDDGQKPGSEHLHSHHSSLVEGSRPGGSLHERWTGETSEDIDTELEEHHMDSSTGSSGGSNDRGSGSGNDVTYYAASLNKNDKEALGRNEEADGADGLGLGNVGSGDEETDEFDGMAMEMYPDVEHFIENARLPDLKDPFVKRERFHRCPGKRQGKGGLEGSCEIFNVQELHHGNIPLLKNFVNEAAMILGRDRTGLCAKCQRKVSTTIKRSRQLGLIPTVCNFVVRDSGLGAPSHLVRRPLGRETGRSKVSARGRAQKGRAQRVQVKTQEKETRLGSLC